MCAWIWFLVTILTCTVSSGTPFQRIDLTGVLYGDDGGGPSGAGTGEVRLGVNGRVYTLHYQKPYRHRFSGANCTEVGSIWKVQAKITEDLEGDLIAVECRGTHDGAVYSAVLLIQRYLKLIESQDFAAAYHLFSPAWRNSHSLAAFDEDAKDLDL